MDYTVYMHTNKINGKKYIGITSQKAENRWAKGEGYKYQLFYRAIKKYGWNNFIHEILKTELTEEQAKAEEIKLISLYGTTNKEKGYNVGLGGEGMFGNKFTETIKRKISNSHKGKEMPTKTKETLREVNKGNKYCLGKKVPKEVKNKISKSLKGNKNSLGVNHTEETKKKMSEKAKGRKHTEETKKKISNSRKGDRNYNSRKIICLNTNEIFNTIIDCANTYEINKNTLCNWLRGARKCTHQYTFMYYDEYLQKNKIEKEI
ncbi:NUMOD3 domain-containing DNA-binding protein [Clostridium sporogenes]